MDIEQAAQSEIYNGAEVYLHDGLYAQYDGWQIRLRAPREDGDHVVYLEPATLVEFVRFAKRVGAVS